jgi:fimbrial isopeptide formation D2 family protein/uncharacterized repeat protein (TIGR01451 family)
MLWLFVFFVSGTVNAQSNLNVSVSPDLVLYGGEAVYTITVTNTGPDKGYNLSLYSDFSQNTNQSGSMKRVEFVSADTPPTTDTLSSNGLIEFENIKDLAVNESYTFHLTVKLSNSGADWDVFDQLQQNVEAKVNSMPDGSGSDDSTTINNSTPVMPISMVEKRALQSVGGEQVTGVNDWPYFYEIEVQNNKELATNGVVVEDVLPDGIEYLGVESGHSCADTRDPATGETTVRCTIGTMGADTTEIVKIKVGIRYDYFGTDNGGGNCEYTNNLPNCSSGSLGAPIPDKTIMHNEAHLETSGNTWDDNILQTYTDHVQKEAEVVAAYATIGKRISAGSNFGNGSALTYEITYTTSEYYNVLDESGEDSITIHDKVPDGLTVAGNYTGATPSSVVVNGDGTTDITWAPADLSGAGLSPLAHSSSFLLTFDVTIDDNWNDGAPIVAGDDITNEVDSDGEWDDQVDTNRANDETKSTASAPLRTIVPVISKEVWDGSNWVELRDGLTVGDEAEFRIRFNTVDGASAVVSNIKLGDIRVTDWLPRGMSYIAGSATETYSDVNDFTDGGNPDAEYEVEIGNLKGVEWNLGDIEQGGWWQATFRAKVDDDSYVANDKIVTNIWKMTGSNTAGGTYSDRDTAQVKYILPHLVLSKESTTPVDPLVPGGDVDYNITITNTGLSPARQIVFEDIIDDSLNGSAPTNVAVQGVNSADYSVNYDSGTRKLSIIFNDNVEIGVSDTLQISYTVTIDDNVGAGTRIDNIASVGYNTQASGSTHAGRSTATNTSAWQDNTDDKVRILPLATINKSVTPNEPIEIGDEITYRLDITVPAQQVLWWPSIEDVINQDGLEYVANSTILSDQSGSPVVPATFDGGANEPAVDAVGSDNTKLTWNLSNPIDNRGQSSDYVFQLEYKMLYTGVEDDGTSWEPVTKNLTVNNEAKILWNDLNVANRSTNQDNQDNATIDVTWASISDLVWDDLDADGIQDPGESGISGIQVHLLDDNDQPVNDPRDGQPYVVTTDSNGNYKFDFLNQGNYKVNFDLPNDYLASLKDSGGDDSVDSDIDNNGLTDVISLAKGEDNSTIDAGLYQKTSLGDLVWEDLNADGIQNPGEVGLSGVVVRLLDSSGNPVEDPNNPGTNYEVTTDGNGQYLFENLDPGTYIVEFVKPAEYVISPQNQGGDDSVDSDVNVGTGRSDVSTLVSQENNLTVDAGMYRLASIGDKVWRDDERDGIQADWEPGLEGVLVELLDGSGNPVDDPTNPGNPYTVTTGPDGQYLFENLIPGDYQVRFTPPADHNPTDKDQGGDDDQDSDIDTTTLTTDVITLVSGENNTATDAGFYALYANVFDPPSAIKTVSDSGENEVEWKMVWINDGNMVAINTQILDEVPVGTTYVPGSVLCEARGNSVTTICTYDATENRIRWEGDIDFDTGGTTEEDSLNEVVITYRTTVPEDMKTVENQALAYWDANGDGDFNDDIARGQSPVLTRNPTGGELTVWEREEREEGDGSIGNTIWLDLNGNGKQDKGEPGLENIRVKLLDDKGRVVARTDTNHNGHYIFKNLPKGKYKIVVKKEDVARYIQTYDPDRKMDGKDTVHLRKGQNYTKGDFGYINQEWRLAKTGEDWVSLWKVLLLKMKE